MVSNTSIYSTKLGNFLPTRPIDPPFLFQLHQDWGLGYVPNLDAAVRIREAASISQKPPTDNVERFLSLLRLESRGNGECFGCLVNLEVSKIDVERFGSLF